MRKTLRYSLLTLITAFCSTVSAEEPGTVPATAFTVAQALEKINALDNAQQSEDMFWVTGTVASINEISTKYGNATFYIKDANGTEQLYIYRAKGFGNENITTEDFIKEGDVVYIRGYFKKYVKDNTVTPEIVNGYIHSVNGKGKEVIYGGDILSVADALVIISALEDGKKTDGDYQVKGYVVGAPDFQRKDDNSLYGNVNLTIADETGGTSLLTVFRAKGYDNANFTEETIDQIKEGDEVTFQGKLQKYVKDGVTTPELVSGYVISINGKTSGISTVKTERTDAPIYNLAGQRVEKALKGVYIQNGKKFVVK